MKVLENPNLDSIDWDHIISIYESVNWKGRTVKDIKRAFQKSTFTCFVYEKDEIVGFGRTFDDGQYYGTICDLVIHPDSQGQGYGKIILNNLKGRMEGFLFTTLTAAPGKAPFYDKMGWKKQTSAYIWPTNQKQEDEHCK
jgi:ribosomal protein S18 acetylase RimI-like enzyme